jgi:transcriptional regulator with AAA-type ATPase domain/tetratricopeptide (TPR) repeat protein
VTLGAELLGESPAMVEVRGHVERLLLACARASRPPRILIQGETGSGKGLVARLIHRFGPRAQAPFVDINCAAVPENLIEAELFGYERGAFTDARRSKPGLFQLATRGTLFLDEVGLLSPSAQGKLLSALEQGEVRRLGSTRPEPVDVWVIAATNEDLDAARKDRRVREDFFQRLAVHTIKLPPLRAHAGDIVPLAEHSLARACADYRLPPRRLASDARELLTAYPWPGNVRELANVIERTVLLSDDTVLTRAHIALPDGAGRDVPVTRTAESSESELARVLEETGWNITHAAARLKITRNTVRARIARAGLRLPRERAGIRPVEAAVPVEAPRAVTWEPRRLVFVRAQVVAAAEPDSRVGHGLDIARDKLLGFGARIEGLTPSAVLALFGADAAEEPAMLAACAALAVQRAAKLTREEGVGLQLTIGLHTDELLAHAAEERLVVDADASRRAWTALDTALDGAAPDAIVATSSAGALLRRRFDLTRLGTTAYRVERVWSADASARGQRGPLVGRDAELAVLEHRLVAAREGRGHVVDIAGEPGIGKSRLVVELLHRAAQQAVRCLEARCLPSEVQTPFSPCLQILRSACDIVDSDGDAVIRAKLHETVAEAGLDPSRNDAHLGYLLGVVSDPPETFGPALTKGLHAALRTLLEALSRRRPLVVVIEDLHWIDATSEEFLAAFVDTVRATRIMVVATYRTGHGTSWVGRPDVSLLNLATLSLEDSRAVVHAVLAADAVPGPIVDEIVERGEGNPLFLEELSLAARERSDEHAPERVPATIEQVITMRMRRLDDESRQILNRAAVIGTEIPRALLRVVSPITDEAFEDGLAKLRSDFLLESIRTRADTVYTFKHALVQRVAYDRLPAPSRHELHARVRAGIEEVYADRLVDHVEPLAHHALEGGDRARAMRYLLQAGQKAHARAALDAAARHLGAGLELLRGAGPDADRGPLELGFQLELGEVLRASKGSGADETAQAFARAVELCHEVGDRSRLGPALAGLWSSHLLRAKYSEARALADELSALAGADPNPVLGAFAARAVGMTAVHVGDFQAARTHLEHGLTLFSAKEHHLEALREYGANPRVSCLAYLGRALWSLGYPDQALARNEEAVEEARARGSAFDVTVALSMLTTVRQLRGELAEMREATKVALEQAQERGVTYWLVRNGLLLKWIEAMTAAEAEQEKRIAEFRDSLERYRLTGTMLGISWLLGLLAQTLAAAGQPFEGLRVLDDALAHVEKTGECFDEAELRGLQGELTLLAGGTDARMTAETRFRHGLDIARAQRARGGSSPSLAGSRGSCTSRAETRRRAISSSRCTGGSPKASRPRTSGARARYSTSSGRLRPAARDTAPAF